MATKNTQISHHEVHVWVAFPDTIRDSALLAAYREMLTDEERAKQRRFHFEHLRHQALITRALVRTTLSRYAEVPPEDWRFGVNGHGRPEIESPAGPPPLRFNLSHASGLIACAVTLEDDIGVDVEDTHRTGIGLDLAERYFSRVEAKELYALPPAQRLQRFFELWTLKEAYIKAKGMGLSIPLDQFSFHMGVDGTLGVSFDSRLDEHPDTWCFWLMRLTERHTAAVALHRGHPGPARISVREVVPLVEDRPMEVFDLHTHCH